LVEARQKSSNQHEFNGVAELKKVFGVNRVESNALFSVRGEQISAYAKVTWYDAREAHVSRSEFRFYFQDNPVMAFAQPGDNIIIGDDGKSQLHCILIRSGGAGHQIGMAGWQQY
jgi:hypothetical protein